jgi:chromosomal replication initiation ATPase DnaA
MKQSVLPIKFDDSYNRYDFIVSSCNFEAYHAVTKGNGVWPHNRLLIIGEDGSGKTHLSRIWHEVAGACYVQSMADIPTEGSAIIDDIEHQHTELELFHILNIAEERKIKLLLTASCPSGWELSDLRSRLNATHQIFIKSPDEAFIPILLAKMFSDQQLLVQAEVLDYIAMRIERSFTAIQSFFHCLNKASMTDKRGITIPLARMILADIVKLDGSPLMLK